MLVYSTKYSLTKGIQEIEAEETTVPGLLIYKSDGNYECHLHGESGDWHRTKSEAVEAVLLIIDRKRKSIDKQLKKLAKLEAKLAK